jgi:hypothetical protein
MSSEKKSRGEPRKRTPKVQRKTAFDLFPEGHPPIDREEVCRAIDDFMVAFEKNKRTHKGIQTFGEIAELRYLNQLKKSPNAQPEKRSEKRDGRAAFTQSSNPNYDPRVMTVSDEEEYDEPYVPVMVTCVDRFGDEHAFDSTGYHRRDQHVYTPEYIKSIPVVSPAAQQHDKMVELHDLSSELVLDKLELWEEFKGDEEIIKKTLEYLEQYKAGNVAIHLKDWASTLLACAERVQESSDETGEDSDYAETEDWTVSSESEAPSDVGALITEIEEFIRSLEDPQSV